MDTDLPGPGAEGLSHGDVRHAWRTGGPPVVQRLGPLCRPGREGGHTGNDRSVTRVGFNNSATMARLTQGQNKNNVPAGSYSGDKNENFSLPFSTLLRV